MYLVNALYGRIQHHKGFVISCGYASVCISRDMFIDKLMEPISMEGGAGVFAKSILYYTL